ncbi:MAG: ferritin [Alphaproteobacteria bacterium]|nr:ferritin [Alphaproteobacteria bacterium]
MISNTILAALNDQITKEIASGYIYLQMAAWCEDNTLPGFANWMRIQWKEELAHAMIFFNYVHERGAVVELGEIEKPRKEYSSITEVFKEVLKHEESVTASINNIMRLAIEEHDYATKNRLEWFIEEQVEEEATASEVLGKLKMFGDDKRALLMMDKEFEGRTYSDPSPLVKGE